MQLPWLPIDLSTPTLTGMTLILAEVIGIISCGHALLYARTAQGATAWCVSLLTVPIVAVPLYWIFGRTRFYGYRERIREVLGEHRKRIRAIEGFFRQVVLPADRLPAPLRCFAPLAPIGVTRGNELELLINGKATFEAIFAGIESAERYILAAFYIINDDGLGNRFMEMLAARAREGIDVRLIYDELGSKRIKRHHLQVLRQAGVRVTHFNTTRGFWNRFQLNFRNHRKIVVIDGKEAFVGGHNVGDEYLGAWPNLSPWRDTHVRVWGPAVQSIQATFAGDWYWASDDVSLDLAWEPTCRTRDAHVLALPSGPSDRRETCTLMFLQAISQAERRVWISTPYLVPDETISQALALAVLRGVDVRILMAGASDHLTVYLASFAHQAKLDEEGVKIYRYEAGFLHQKAFLVDDNLACITTANLDNRSLRLNFELSVLSDDPIFCRDVEEMLEVDFSGARRATAAHLWARSFPFRLAVAATRLVTPVL